MKKKLIIFSILVLLLMLPNAVTIISAEADQLNDSINEQIENIDLSGLQDFLDSQTNLPNNVDFFQMISDLLSGNYKSEAASAVEYVFEILLNGVYRTIPVIISVLAIAIICSLVKNLRMSNCSSGVILAINFVSISVVIVLVGTQLLSFFNETKNIIENIANLSEIMSPIILTLMVASGGNVSAGIYSPTVSFLSSGIINIFLSIILPIVGVTMIIAVISSLSDNVKLNKLSDFFSSILKWIFGLTVTVFSLFLTVQGIAAATFDGISIKAAKYAISNSITIVGGFISGGFDLVLAGSVIIKNTLGIVTVFILFYVVVYPIINMAVFSMLLKLVSGLVEPTGENNISGFCTAVSKSISYLIAAVACVGLMLFITILLMMFSASALV